jgi:hypothetical protein
LLGNVFDRHDPAAPSHKESKPLAVKRIVRQPRQLLLLHFHAPRAIDTTHLDLQVNAIIPTRQISHPASFAVVPPSLGIATGTANRFFPRRLRKTTRPSDHRNPLYPGSGAKAREVIRVPQPSMSSHPEIMPDFLTLEIVKSPSYSVPFSCYFYPLEKEKSLRNKSCYNSTVPTLPVYHKGRGEFRHAESFGID